jgi:hypothetical protein
VVPRNQLRLLREVPLSDRSASASFRSTGSAMLGDFLMEEIRRHWQLVCLAFSFCWWAYGRLPTSSLEEPAERTEEDLPAESVERGEKETQGVVAGGVEGGEGVAGALCHALALLESVHQSAPSDGAKSAA